MLWSSCGYSAEKKPVKICGSNREGPRSAVCPNKFVLQPLLRTMMRMTKSSAPASLMWLAAGRNSEETAGP